MRISRFAWTVFSWALAMGIASSAARGASKAEDPLALVPADAASVAVVHLDRLRSSPLSARLFSDADRMTADGDAARFLAEANLSPKKDVDTVVIASEPVAGDESRILALFYGRFDPARLASAAQERGAQKRSSAGGDYELLPDTSDGAHTHTHKGAVAFVDSNLVIAGTESAVVEALAARRSGKSRFVSDAGLGKQLARVHRDAAAWALVDMSRYPALQKGAERSEKRGGRGEGEPAAALASAMRAVTLFAVDATPRPDGLDLAATGFVADAETRQLVEDSLRGLLAMWRLAVQDKQPELVSALRKFRIASDNSSVTIQGTLPASVLKSLAERKNGPWKSSE